MTAPICCFIECEEPAEFVVHTLRNGEGLMAGPDPYGDVTEACVEHVGHLLGHQPECRNPEEVYWTVRSLP